MDKIADYQERSPDCAHGADGAVNAPGLQCGLPPGSATTLIPERFVTIAQLSAFAVDRRHRELAQQNAGPQAADKSRAKKSRHQVHQLSSMLNQILKKFSPQGPDTLASVALENAASWVKERAEAGNRKYRQEHGRLEVYLADMAKLLDGSGDVSKNLPKGYVRRFGQVLNEAIKKSNHTQHSLAIKLGINPAKISKWIWFTNIPRNDPITVSQVSAIEVELNAEGELIPLLDEISKKPSIPVTVGKAPKLQNFGLGKRPALWAAKGAHYLCEEFGEFVELIADPSEPRPDQADDKGPAGQDDDDNDDDDDDDDVVLIPGKYRRKGSLESDANHFGQYFGFARRWIATPALSTAYIVNTRLLNRFIKFKKNRRKARGKSKMLTRRDTRAILVFIQFTYLLEKRPEYGARYLPAEGLLKRSETGDAQKDWAGTCKRARKALRKIYNMEKKRAAPRENDEDSIENILRDKEPLNALFAIADTLRLQLDKLPLFADCKTTAMKMRRAKRLRDFFVVSVVLIPSAFRPGTGWRLTWGVDENGRPSGSMRYAHSDDGKATVWQVVVSRLDFKNHASDILARGFKRKLSYIVDARDYDYLDEYIGEARALLTGAAKTDALIVRSEKFPRHSARSFSEYVCRLTSRIMTQFPRDEYHGATRLSSNQIRKILATSSYNGTESMEEAEKAIASRQAPVYTHIQAEKLSESSERHVAKARQEWSRKQGTALGMAGLR